jgi:SAM-dependent methyltransferase
MDVSTAAARRAARAHPRAGAVVADVWAGLPLRDATVGVILDVFAPRNAAEFHRVLRPDGALVVVAPTRAHLARLVEDLGLLAVDERKPQRLAETLAGHFVVDTEDVVEFGLTAGPAEVEQLVLMGPSAHHVDPAALRERIARLTRPATVEVSVTITRYRPRRR